MSVRIKVRSRMIEVLLAAATAVSVPAFATETHRFNVPVEDAAAAIRDFASQARVQILVADDNVKDKHLHSVAGEYSTDQGLKLLLADSGLTPQYVGDHSIALVTQSDANLLLQTGAGKDGNSSKENQRAPGDQQAPFRDSFRLAQESQGSPAANTSVARENGEQAVQKESVRLEEVLVTAQKKEERLQEVPVPVSVVDTESLEQSGTVFLKDYYSRVPSLSFTPGEFSTADIAIRGITTGGYTIPTVGLMVDGVPFGGFAASDGAGQSIPELDPGELDRIEVLRGPQGTLYGASSLGGLLNFVTKDPSTAGFSGRVEGGISNTYNSAKQGYSFRGSVNVPITDSFAVLASAFSRQDAGYIDNPVTNIKGVNEDTAYGAHISALWRPSAGLSIKLSALYQSLRTDGNSEVQQAAGLGSWEQNYIPGAGKVSIYTQAYSAIVNYNIGGITLSSLTGYNRYVNQNSTDYSSSLGSFAQNGVPGVFAGYGVSGATFYGPETTGRLTQELRLTTNLLDKADLQIGGFYSRSTGTVDGQAFLAVNPANGVVVGSLIDYHGYVVNHEEAVFGDLTYHFTDAFNIQLGARESYISERFPAHQDTGPLVPVFDGSPSPFTNPALSASANSFTYLVTPQYKVSPDLMIYARLASGFRPGGYNSLPGKPAQYSPDHTYNYELGLKGEFFDRQLFADVSLFYIAWDNIQQTVTSPIGQYFINGSTAKSDGVELSVSYIPIPGLNIAGWFVYDDAVLTRDFPLGSANYGVAGDRLPASARLSGNLSVDYSWSLPLLTGAKGFVGATSSMIGDRLGIFTPTPQRQNLPGYVKLDLRTGVKSGSWTTTIYANNVLNQRGLLNGGVGYYPTDAFLYIQPRTIGITISNTF